jgi:hypothetical protein
LAGYTRSHRLGVIGLGLRARNCHDGSNRSNIGYRRFCAVHIVMVIVMAWALPMPEMLLVTVKGMMPTMPPVVFSMMAIFRVIIKI